MKLPENWNFEKNKALFSEMKKMNNKLQQIFFENNMLDEDSKKVLKKLKNWEISAIKVKLPSGWCFVYGSFWEFEDGMSVILEMIKFDSKIILEEVENLDKEIENVIDQFN